MSEKKVEMKICSKCKVSKEETEFGKDRTGGSRGLHSQCKGCCSIARKIHRGQNLEKYLAREKKYRDDHPDKIKASNRKAHLRNPRIEYGKNLKLGLYYGISLLEKNALIAKQGEKCAVCLNSFKSPKHCHVDHCHVTKKVRGILCHHCNLGIGHLKDSPEILLAAIAYLDTP